MAKIDNLLNPLPYVQLGAAVAKFRRAACDGLQQMSREQRQAYGAAVEEAVKKAQRFALLGPARTSLTVPKYSPPSIERLTKYINPIRMAGDPAWSDDQYDDRWRNRAEAVYAEAMKNKNAFPWAGA